jgi:hypothetical protein
MKNIHLIPTDKPSRLYKQTGALSLDTISDTSNDGISINQNIYITSDEEIKEGDWVIQVNFEKTNIQLIQCITKFQTKIANDKDGSFTKNKIILTTDQDLIKDGVQAIDDEFLEWFVKNPTCEEVGVIKVCSTGRKCDGKGKNCNMAKLKIIIPKEEQKQDYSGVHLRHCYQGEYEDGCKYGEDDCPAKPLEKPKKLTDLEIAIKLEEIEREEFQQETVEKGLMEIELNHTKILVYSCERALEERNEQIKRMYSEGEVLQLLLRLQQTESYDNLYDWFEKYKKK